MGALPNTTPSQIRHSERKQPARATKPGPVDLRPEPRDLATIEREFVYGRTGKAGTGWSSFSFSFSADRFRLSSGETFYKLTDYLMHSAQRGRKADEELSFETELNIAEAALLLRVSERQINRELLYMTQRDMAIVARLGGGLAVVRLMIQAERIDKKVYPGWSKIEQSYADWAEQQRQSLDERTDEAEAEEAALAELEKTHVTIKPHKVKAGGSRKSKIQAFVKSLRIECDSDSTVDLSLSGEVASGELVLNVCSENRKTSSSKSDAKRAVSATSEKTPGHGRPNEQKSPPNAGIKNHPQRGEEIAAIFDPLLLQSRSSILSADPQALRAACEAAGDTPQDFLSEFVRRRARRSVQGPLVCVAICKDAKANWDRIAPGSAAAADPGGAPAAWEPGWIQKFAASRRKVS